MECGVARLKRDDRHRRNSLRGKNGEGGEGGEVWGGLDRWNGAVTVGKRELKGCRGVRSLLAQW